MCKLFTWGLKTIFSVFLASQTPVITIEKDNPKDCIIIQTQDQSFLKYHKKNISNKILISNAIPIISFYGIEITIKNKIRRFQMYKNFIHMINHNKEDFIVTRRTNEPWEKDILYGEICQASDTAKEYLNYLEKQKNL